jgi:tRNA-specific 2-thiouridylase
MQKVFVGLSGGVDSATSAALLKKAGYKVIGAFIKIQIPGYPCPAAEDRIEAMRVAAHLDIPFVEIDLSKEYEQKVFDFAVREFERGRTPNPDALCNREIKFGAFYDFAMTHGADFVATGHYARVREGKLFIGTDDQKDQSYFLWAVPQEHLAKTLFPIGGLTKPEVRALAKKLKLPNSRRPDSQGLCFLGDISITDMLKQEIAPQPGDVLDESGTTIGTHEGASLYTLGQRHGFILKGANPKEVPHFVVGKDMQKNTITVSGSRFPKQATKTKLTLTDENWIGTHQPGEYMARFRYRQKLIAVKLTEAEGKTVVVLQEPHYAPEGQSLVLYKGEECVGGGIIDTAALV